MTVRQTSGSGRRRVPVVVLEGNHMTETKALLRAGDGLDVARRRRVEVRVARITNIAALGERIT